jgi:hypothetical protein
MRRALCIGIDFYSFGSLRGCVRDAERVSKLLMRHEDGTINFDCRTLKATLDGKGDTINKVDLRKAINELFISPAEVALLHFSGHGTENNLDGFLVTQDAKSYDEGIGMSEILKIANNSKVDEVVIFLDCCNSGNLGNIPSIDNNKAVLREGISILTASRGYQVSVETSGEGLFTSLIADALEGGGANLLGDITAPSIYAFVESALGAWDQRPLFKSHVSKLISLRKCKPPIDISILRDLICLFPVPAEDIQLSPEYEPTCKHKNERKNEIFCKLQSLNRVHLVIPIGTTHMFEAAMQSKSCRLTATGRYYWRLAKDGRI